MAVVGQDRLGLSPFGMLSRVFNQEILQRSQLMTGAYREVPLTLLEEEEEERVPSASKPPELHLDVAVNVTVEAPEEQKKNNAGQETPPPAERRILERVRVLERELRQSRETTRRVILQAGPHRQAVRLPAERPDAADGASPIRESLSLTDGASRTDGPGTGRGGALRPMTRARDLPLASAATAAPAGGGWTPKQQPLHPGYPAAQKEAPAGGTAAGSILLPDALRRRRQEILDRQSKSPRSHEELGPALEWAVQGTEGSAPTASVRLARMVEEAVHRTLEQNRAPQIETAETGTDRLTRDPATAAAPGKPAVPAQSRRDGAARTAEAASPRRGAETAGGRPAPEAGPVSELPAGENRAPEAPKTIRQAPQADVDPAAESRAPDGAPSAEAPRMDPAGEAGDPSLETLEQRTGIPPEPGKAGMPWTPPELAYRQHEADRAPASGGQETGQTGSQTRRPPSAQKETETAPTAERGTREVLPSAHWEHDLGSAGTPSAAVFDEKKAGGITGGGPHAAGEVRVAGEERAPEPSSQPAGKRDLKDGSALAAVPPDRREETRQEVPLIHRRTPETGHSEAERAAGPEAVSAEAPAAALSKRDPEAGRKVQIPDAEKAAVPAGPSIGRGEVPLVYRQAVPQSDDGADGLPAPGRRAELEDSRSLRSASDDADSQAGPAEVRGQEGSVRQAVPPQEAARTWEPEELTQRLPHQEASPTPAPAEGPDAKRPPQRGGDSPTGSPAAEPSGRPGKAGPADASAPDLRRAETAPSQPARRGPADLDGQRGDTEADRESVWPLLGRTPGQQPWTPVPLEQASRDGRPDGAEPAPRTLGRGKAAAQQAARDIRVTAPGRGPRPPMTGRPGETPDSHSAAAFERMNQLAGPEEESGPSAAIPRSGRMWTGAPELTFAQPPWERQEADRQPGTPPEAPKSDYLNSLPQWARELLEKPAAPASGARPMTWQAPQGGSQGPAAGMPHGGPAQQAGAAPGGMVQWTAPGAQTAAPDVTTRPASIQYREKAGPEGQPASPRAPVLSEAEVQKTADKVYRIIEERLRRELRRSGK